MKNRKISIIICVVDDLRIDKMLKSINENCEVVIVLNGATKEVKEIVNSYKNNNIFQLKVIEIPERNLSKARNVGAKEAKYDKLIFYDSDCELVGKAIDLYDKKLDKYMLVDGSVKFKSETFQSKIVSVLRSFGLPGCALCPSIGINKKIVDKIGYYFDEDIKWIEDSELNIRVKRAGIKVGIIDELTCIHDNLSFKSDLRSAFRYGTGVKIAAMKGLHKKKPTANWNLIIPCFKKNFFSGIYCIIWNIIYCLGYYLIKY